MARIIKGIICMACIFPIILSCNQQPNSPNLLSIDEQDKLVSLEKAVKTEVEQLPFWGRTDVIPVLDGYGVIYFYVQDPSVIPHDFNLLWFFDFRALAHPLAVAGFAVYSAPNDFVPKKTHLTGKGAVPFWFITEDQLAEAMNDYIITIPELESFNPIKGTATHFIEDLHPIGFPPPGGHPQPGLKAEAQGELVDGGTFHFNFETHLHKGRLELRGNVKLHTE